jgi:serine/threonine protein phosphatase PrpC
MSEKTDTGERVNVLDRSGSCAIAVLIVEKRCYIANVGDSRAIMSGNFGEKVYSLSRDHRPCDEKEYNRVIEAGGKIYQTEANIIKCGNEAINTNILGPLRVIPGRLSVSRTIGDIEAKDPRCGGNPNVVIGTPEIKYFDINPTNDFIIIGCDGIFEKMKNKEIIDSLWKVINNPSSSQIKDSHHLSGILVENLIDTCLLRKSTDNLTAVMISFKNNLRNKDTQIVSNYVSQTQQLNKIPKVIKTEGNSNSNSNQNQMDNNLLSKIIKSTQGKINHQVSDKFMILNK